MHSQKIPVDEFLVAHGGPFFELQRRLGLLRGDTLRAGLQAPLFVGLAWGVPLVLSLLAGNAFGQRAEHPYLLDLRVWGRFFLAVGLFILSVYDSIPRIWRGDTIAKPEIKVLKFRLLPLILPLGNFS